MYTPIIKDEKKKYLVARIYPDKLHKHDNANFMHNQIDSPLIIILYEFIPVFDE